GRVPPRGRPTYRVPRAGRRPHRLRRRRRGPARRDAPRPRRPEAGVPLPGAVAGTGRLQGGDGGRPRARRVERRLAALRLRGRRPGPAGAGGPPGRAPFVVGNSFSAGAAVWAAAERPSAIAGL